MTCNFFGPHLVLMTKYLKENSYNSLYFYLKIILTWMSWCFLDISVCFWTINVMYFDGFYRKFSWNDQIWQKWKSYTKCDKNNTLRSNVDVTYMVGVTWFWVGGDDYRFTEDAMGLPRQKRIRARQYWLLLGHPSFLI